MTREPYVDDRFEEVVDVGLASLTGRMLGEVARRPPPAAGTRDADVE